MLYIFPLLHFYAPPVSTPVLIELIFRYRVLLVVVELFTKVDIPSEEFSETYTLVSVRMKRINKLIVARYKGSDPKIGDYVTMDFERIGDLSVYVFKTL